MEICPRCQQRYVRALNSADYVHSCNSGENTLDQEDVKVIGNWDDYTGTQTVTKGQVMTEGITNELYGSDAGIRGGVFRGVTDRGAPKQSRRQRQHLEYIPSLGGDCKHG